MPGVELPAGRHLRAAVRADSPSTTCSSASCSSTSTRPVEALRRLQRVLQAGRHDHRDRGRPRLGLLPPRQRRRARRDRVPGRSSSTATRTSAACLYPLLTEAGLHDVQRLAARWSTSTPAAPTSSRASPGARSRRWSRASARRDRQRADRRRALRPGDRRPLPHRRGRRHLLLHVLQGDGSASLSLRSSSIERRLLLGASATRAARARSSRCAGVTRVDQRAALRR